MSAPFSRSWAMFALIAAAEAGPTAQADLAAMAPYRSRGHGRGKAFDKHRHGNKAGKYRPHQGTQECLRRELGGWAKTVNGKRSHLAAVQEVGHG